MTTPQPKIDLADHDVGFLQGLYERMVLIREFEEGVKFLFLEGTMPGTIHQCQGQEACAVGVCAALESTDWITSNRTANMFFARTTRAIWTYPFCLLHCRFNSDSQPKRNCSEFLFWAGICGEPDIIG